MSLAPVIVPQVMLAGTNAGTSEQANGGVANTMPAALNNNRVGVVTGPGPISAPATPINTWFWYGTPAAFLLASVIALVTYGWIARRGERATGSVSGTPFAYLIKSEDEPRFVISQSPWRIGRSKTNELTVNDNSVSRQHAEIRRNNDGTFTIVDLDSLNGVFVNERKVKNSELNEGDTVDVGDVNMRFTLYDNDYAAQEPTVMIRTQVP
jgi:hypothetical protein